jgi:hypothetical protein
LRLPPNLRQPTSQRIPSRFDSKDPSRRAGKPPSPSHAGTVGRSEDRRNRAKPTPVRRNAAPLFGQAALDRHSAFRPTRRALAHRDCRHGNPNQRSTSLPTHPEGKWPTLLLRPPTSNGALSWPRMVASARHRRILTALAIGDLLWEVVGESHFTQYNERTGKEIRVQRDILEAMENVGWIHRVTHEPSAHRLDFWEIAPLGRQILGRPATSKKGADSRPLDRTERHASPRL